jgi:hypothetical protein
MFFSSGSIQIVFTLKRFITVSDINDNCRQKKSDKIIKYPQIKI